MAVFQENQKGDAIVPSNTVIANAPNRDDWFTAPASNAGKKDAPSSDSSKSNEAKREEAKKSLLSEIQRQNPALAGKILEITSIEKFVDMLSSRLENARPKEIMAAAGAICKLTDATNYSLDVFYALSKPEIMAKFAENPQTVTDVFIGMLKAASDPAVFTAISNDKIATLFANNLSKFLQIVEAAGTSTISVLLFLSNDKLAVRFSKDPEIVADAIISIFKSGASEKASGADILNAILSNNGAAPIYQPNRSPSSAEVPVSINLIDLFAAYPSEFAEISNIVARQHIDKVFAALSDKNISIFFAEHPKQVISLIKEVLGGRLEPINGDCIHLFSLLSNEKIAAKFLKDPDSVIKVFKTILVASESFDSFAPLSNSKLSDLFADNMGEFVTISKAARGQTNLAFAILAKSPLLEKFAADPKGIVNVFTDISISGNFDFLSNEKLARLFTEFPQEFASISKSSGSDALLAIADDNTAALFRQYPSEFTAIAKTAGFSAKDAFPALSNEVVSPLFKKHTAEFLKISAVAGFDTGAAFTAISIDSVAALFDDHPAEFVKIAEAATDTTSYIFSAFSNKKLAEKFKADPQSVVIALAAIASASERSNQIFTTFNDEKLVSLFCDYTPEFVELAKLSKYLSSGDQTDLIQMFYNDGISALFTSHPADFVELAKAMVAPPTFEEIKAMVSFGNKRITLVESVSKAFDLIANNIVMLNQFGDSPSEFVELAKAGGRYTLLILESLGQQGTELFDKHPAEFIKFAKAVKITEEFDRSNPFICLGWVSQLFEANPARFAEIAEAVGEGISDVLVQLNGNGQVTDLFQNNYPKYLEIAKTCGQNTGAALDLMFSNPTISAAYEKDPKTIGGAVIEIMGALRTTESEMGSMIVDYMKEHPEASELFVSHPNEFAKIAQSSGAATYEAFLTLMAVSDKFAGDPTTVTNALVKIANVSKEVADTAFFYIRDNKNLLGMFAKDPSTLANAFAAIAKSAEKDAGEAFKVLFNGPISEKFAANPALIVKTLTEIADAASYNKGQVFMAIANSDRIAALLVSHPVELVKIAKAAGLNTSGAFYNLSSELFVEHTKEYLKIAKAAGQWTGNAYALLTIPAVSEKFKQDPEGIANLLVKLGKASNGEVFALMKQDSPIYHVVFSDNTDVSVNALIKIAKTSRKSKEVAFDALANTFIADAFRKDPMAVANAFAKLSKAAGNEREDVYRALSTGSISESFVKYSPDEISSALSGIAKSAHKEGISSPFLFLAMGEQASKFAINPEGYRQDFARIHYASELAGVYGVSPDSEEIRKKAKAIGALGITIFSRYDKEILDNIYLTAAGQGVMSKKIAFVVLNKNDWNDAFADDQKMYHDLMDHGYNLIVCEADDERELKNRFFNYGQTKKDRDASKHFKQGQSSHKRYDLFIIGGHGEPARINLGPSKEAAEKDEADISISDYRKGKRYNWEKMMVDDGKCVLMSCSTGSKELTNYSKFQNVMDMIGDLTHRDVLAPSIPVTGVAFVYGNDNQVADVRWTPFDEGMPDVGNRHRASEKKAKSGHKKSADEK